MLVRKFWWGQGGEQGKIHWKNWKTLCKPKNEGGWVLRSWQSSMIQCWQSRYGNLFMIQNTFPVAPFFMLSKSRVPLLGKVS